MAKLDQRRPKGDTGIAEIYTAEMGQPPMEPDSASAITPAPAPMKPKKPVKKAAGGSIGSASKRADGCAQRGKTRGKMV